MSEFHESNRRASLSRHPLHACRLNRRQTTDSRCHTVTVQHSTVRTVALFHLPADSLRILPWTRLRTVRTAENGRFRLPPLPPFNANVVSSRPTVHPYSVTESEHSAFRDSGAPLASESHKQPRPHDPCLV